MIEGEAKSFLDSISCLLTGEIAITSDVLKKIPREDVCSSLEKHAASWKTFKQRHRRGGIKHTGKNYRVSVYYSRHNVRFYVNTDCDERLTIVSIKNG